MFKDHGIAGVLVLAALGLVFCLSTARLSYAHDFECGAEDSMITLQNNPVDTITGVAVYCAWDDTSRSDSLPSYWAAIWDSIRRFSVPQYFIDNTNWKHVVYCHPYAKDSLTAFTSTWEPKRWPGFHLANFTEEILTKADSVIDFSNYVPSGDSIVPHVWLMVLDYYGPWDTLYSFNRLVLPQPYYFETQDTTPSGKTVLITEGRGSTIQAHDDENEDMTQCIHEYCHDFGWPDLYHRPSPEHNPGNWCV